MLVRWVQLHPYFFKEKLVTKIAAMNFGKIQIQFALRVSKEKAKICTQSLKFLATPLTLVHSRGKMKYSTIFLLPQWHRSSVRTKNYECPLEARDTTTLLLLQNLGKNKQIVLFRQRLPLVKDACMVKPGFKLVLPQLYFEFAALFQV